MCSRSMEDIHTSGRAQDDKPLHQVREEFNVVGTQPKRITSLQRKDQFLSLTSFFIAVLATLDFDTFFVLDNVFAGADGCFNDESSK